jgi:hypothetical protein
MAESEKQTRDYYVLEQHGATSSEESQAHNSNVWFVEVGQINARSAQAAVAAHVKSNSIQAGGTFVAIAARSFQPVEVGVETQTKLTFK